jgi:hypothetical protein
LLNFGLKLGGRGDHNPYISPLNRLIILLFSNNEQGAFYIPRPVVNGVQSLFQDAAGTVAVTADGDPSGRMVDQSPNSHAAVQSTSAARPTYNTAPDRLSLDKVDDALIITVPAGGFVGTMVLATDKGTASYGVSIDAGAYDLGGKHFPGDAIVGAVYRDGAMTAKEKADTESLFVGNGATASYGAVTNFDDFWRDKIEITSFPLIDTSSGVSLFSTWAGLRNITSFPSINTINVVNFSRAWSFTGITSFPLLDTSSGTDFSFTWRRTPVEIFPQNFFDDIQGGNFVDAFDSTNLTEASIDGILVSLVTSGIASGTRRFDQTGGSAPSVGTGQPAIDTLRSRGWTVTVTGGY